MKNDFLRQVCQLPEESWVTLTITYAHGPHGQEQGHLLNGDTVRLADGMVFNLART